MSVDLPSGLCADLPVIEGPTVSADLTVTFTALKPALVFPPAVDRAGRVKIAQIGAPIRLLENEQYRLNLIDAKQIRRAIPTRPRDSHKGNFGHVFVVAGSRGKSGAALMTGLAALRSGAGLVTLFLPLSLQGEFFGKCPELMTEYLPETAEGSIDGSSSAQILAHLDPAHVLIIGPGLTTEDSTQTLVRDLVHRSPVPVVLDADGINAFALQPEALRNYLGQAVIITPHPGEMARLIGRSISEVQADRLTCARGFSEKHGCFTILKGFQTLVVTPDGRIFINSTGNPGMATGGSGDILAGMVGRFVAGWQCRFRGSELQAAADYMAAAVYLHGLAGDLVAEEKGEESMIATDLLPQLPQAFKRIKQR